MRGRKSDGLTKKVCIFLLVLTIGGILATYILSWVILCVIFFQRWALECTKTLILEILATEDEAYANEMLELIENVMIIASNPLPLVLLLSMVIILFLLAIFTILHVTKVIRLKIS